MVLNNNNIQTRYQVPKSFSRMVIYRMDELNLNRTEKKKILRYLLDNGADLNHRDNKGRTPLEAGMWMLKTLQTQRDELDAIAKRLVNTKKTNEQLALVLAVQTLDQNKEAYDDMLERVKMLMDKTAVIPLKILQDINANDYGLRDYVNVQK